jgi:carboxylesterase type B
MFDIIQHSLPTPDFEISELHGLHLNITIPLTEGKLLAQKNPVLVHILGGGFGGGSNLWPQYDQARLVRLSLDKGMPIIGVGIK